MYTVDKGPCSLRTGSEILGPATIPINGRTAGPCRVYLMLSWGKKPGASAKRRSELGPGGQGQWTGTLNSGRNVGGRFYGWLRVAASLPGRESRVDGGIGT